MGKKILVIDDDKMLVGTFCAFLARNGWDVEACDSAKEALAIMKTRQPDCVLAEQRLPGMTGIEFVHHALAIDRQVKIIVMSKDRSAQTAVQAMRAGAYDYLAKPVALAELGELLERALSTRYPAQPQAARQAPQETETGLKSLLGDSPAMQELKTTIRQILDAETRMAACELPAVLICGETGTGKELVARAMHIDGARRDGPFVEINCASIPSHLLEAELFGHEKGAFTDAREQKIGLVESADGGTLFLDEIGEIDPLLQAKLLKLLEDKTIRRLGSVKERKVNLRIISATNRDLEQLVRAGKFRSDLYFRLRIIAVNAPPLRARGNDILLLARHFLDWHGRRYGRPGLYFSAEAEDLLMNYTWPGNVREMRNMLEQTVLLAQHDTITATQIALCPNLPPEGEREPLLTHDNAWLSTLKGAVTLNELEKQMVVQALEQTGWNVSKSSRLLGISRDMMRYRITRLGLVRPDFASVFSAIGMPSLP